MSPFHQPGQRAVRRILPPIALFLLAFFLTSCGNPAPSGKPLVLCTIFAYYDAARAIAGDAANVQILLPERTSPHGYQTTPHDKVTAHNAQLFIKNGLGLDDYFDKLLDGSSAKVLTISKEIPQDLLVITKETAADPNQPGEEHNTGTNPHIWLNPQIQIKAAQAIRDALIAMDPSHTSTFEANAKNYIDDLEKLDAQFKEAAARFKNKDFIGFHSAYDYLAHRYGLNQIASIEEIPNTGLTPAGIRNIIKLIQDHHIRYVAVESALGDQGMNLIKEQTQVQTITLEPLETYDDLKDTYPSLMRKNLDSLKTALGT